jgi:hypothetical protein
MAITSKRCLLILSFLAVALPMAAGDKDTPVQGFHIYVDQPVYTNLPVWIKADLSYPLEAHYPCTDNPGDFGPNQLEVKREGQVLLPRSTFQGVGSVGEGIVDGWVAPASAPTNRLPLHLRYTINEPGTYSVRWTKVQHTLKDGRPTQVVVARSDWLAFEVGPSTAEQREAWLQKQLSTVPKDPGQLAGDFLPSLLAAAPDPRALHLVLEQLYSTEQLISNYARLSLHLFRDNDIRTQAVELLHQRGPSDGLAGLLAWNALFQDCKEDLVRTILPYLHSPNDRQVAPTLTLLRFLAHGGTSEWPANSKVPSEADGAVLAVAHDLVKRGGEVPQMLALYLDGVKSNERRELLWRLAERPEPEHEQAYIVLAWIGDERDLPRLAELLLKPGDSDVYGRDRASLPYHLMRAYGDPAIPYLEQAISESPYVFVQTESAKELALKGRPVAFRFFLDAAEHNRFYKPELMNWLKDYFPNDLPRSANDEAVIVFLNSRLRR